MAPQNHWRPTKKINHWGWIVVQWIWGARSPYQRTPSWEIPDYKLYIMWVFMGYFIPKNPKVEHNKYHGYTFWGYTQLSLHWDPQPFEETRPLPGGRRLLLPRRRFPEPSPSPPTTPTTSSLGEPRKRGSKIWQKSADFQLSNEKMLVV